MGGGLVISRPCYCNRDDVLRAADFKDSVLSTDQIDRALASSADNIEGQLHRHFYPVDGTRYFDWPNYQYAEPWRLWLGRHDLLCLTALQSPGGADGDAIPLWQVFLEPVNRQRGFPYTHVELDRSTVAAWGIGPTPQHAIWLTGTWGFTGDADQVATLAAGIDSATSTLTLSSGAGCGAGDVLIIGYGRSAAPFPSYPGTAGAVAPYVGERVIVVDKTASATGLTQSGSGCSSAQNSDVALSTTGTGALYAGEVIQLDQERMLVEQVVGGVATVRRAWDGTILAPHTTAAVYAYRQLTVLRGELGTAAAAASSGTAVSRHRVPSLVRDLAIAETTNQVLQELAGYSRTVGSGEAAMHASGLALADKWAEVVTRFGRKARKGAI